MNERIHIIITGDRGKTLKMHFARRSVCTLALFSVMLLVCLVITSIFSASLFTRNRSVSQELTDLQIHSRKTDDLLAHIQRKADAERSKLYLQIASLKRQNASQLENLSEEKDLLLSTAVNELSERSELIENIISNLGVKVSNTKVKKITRHSGGPFIEPSPGLKDELLYTTDLYLDTLKALPLGKPVTGKITSRFGPRTDPLNKKKSYHEGTDFKGKMGQNIYSTGAGVVTQAYYSRSYGNFVEIDHKNGFKTSFAHMKKFLVSKGDRVERGQVIGQVGSTGRSTGPHLHYELLYKNKPINPTKFFQVSKLVKPSQPVAETK